MTRKFDVYANNADTVLMKQQARAALRRAVKAENDFIRREEVRIKPAMSCEATGIKLRSIRN